MTNQQLLEYTFDASGLLNRLYQENQVNYTPENIKDQVYTHYLENPVEGFTDPSFARDMAWVIWNYASGIVNLHLAGLTVTVTVTWESKEIDPSRTRPPVFQLNAK